MLYKWYKWFLYIDKDKIYANCFKDKLQDLFEMSLVESN